jgi:hypothetical protein
MRKYNLAALTMAAAVTMVSAGNAFAKFKFTNFDVPGGIGGTFPLNINDTDEVTGHYEDQSDVHHGFVRTSDGMITSFDVPTASSTDAVAINGKGVIVGTFSDSASVTHGFIRSADGTITTFDPAGSTGTTATGINADGEVTGGYLDSTGHPHSFLRKRNGQFVVFSPDGSVYDFGLAINNKDQIAGAYCLIAGCNPFNAYIRSKDGVITTFSVPNAKWTLPDGIDSKGAIVGNYTLQGSPGSGFLRDAQGVITSLPCATVDGIGGGWIVGHNVTGANQINQGCLIAPNGKVKIVDDPDAGDDAFGQGTQPTAINSKHHIAGYYRDSNNTYHGFVALPR